ncbi:MAG TPA: fructose-6-phosphate aldolase [Dehalococcoidia bacterium]|nr:fructose-6-phosphate aldolase [Dehalococcoidia bacterium]
MRLFLDTANIDEIRQAVRMGVLAGVTTNPTLMAKESGVTYRDRVVEICEAVNGPVSAECTSREVEGLVEEGRQIASWHPNVVVKIPVDANGLEATSILSREGIKINMTLVFSANQSLLAALAGATYVSPFVGRLDDAGHDGMEVVRQSVQIFDNYHLPAQVLAASIRGTTHVIQAAIAGSHVATVPFAVLQAMLKHPLTDAGIERFLADSRKYAAV